MIKGIILDVDGVIVGDKIGYNSPHPHPEVLARLKTIEENGIPVSLCSAKPYYAIKQIIDSANLRSMHITEGGAVIIDPLDDVVLATHSIDKVLAQQVVNAFLSANVYVEAYAKDEYLLEERQKRELTQTHSHVLQCQPRFVHSLIAEIGGKDIFKIMPIATDKQDKTNLEAIFEPFADELTLSWGVHPIALPHQFGIITAKGISKQQAALEIAAHNQIKPDELLGIGDSTSDWQFISQCGYAATLENGSSELKKLVTDKGKRSFIGGSVDDNGLLQVLDYFGL